MKYRLKLKYILFLIFDFFVKDRKKIEIKPNTLLLIRFDAIGDYILFRNFIEVLGKSEKYKSYKISFVGNIVYKELAKELDKDYIDEFIWIDRDKFNKNLFYRYKKLKKISSQGYETIINPMYSREFFYSDNIVKLISANEKIGSVGDLSSITKWQKRISDKYYTKLIDVDSEIMFEFYRNRDFFQNLLNKNIYLKKPSIQLREKSLSFSLEQKYAVLFVGASRSYRKWSIKNFIDIGKFIKDRYGYHIVLCGGSADIDDADEFKKMASFKYLDLVGKTSLLDFLYVLKDASMLVSNETSAPHIAVALDVKNIFVISNGNHFGRFTPYPKEIWDDYHCIYHPIIEKDLGDYEKLSNSYGYGSKLDINDISLEDVKNKIELYFNNKV